MYIYIYMCVCVCVYVCVCIYLFSHRILIKSLVTRLCYKVLNGDESLSIAMSATLGSFLQARRSHDHEVMPTLHKGMLWRDRLARRQGTSHYNLSCNRERSAYTDVQCPSLINRCANSWVFTLWIDMMGNGKRIFIMRSVARPLRCAT